MGEQWTDFADVVSFHMAMEQQCSEMPLEYQHRSAFPNNDDRVRCCTTCVPRENSAPLGWDGSQALNPTELARDLAGRSELRMPDPVAISDSSPISSNGHLP